MPQLSTVVPEKPSVGAPLPKCSVIICTQSSKPLLRRPLEPSQYTAIDFGTRCREAGVRPSMGSAGDCYDNALCESFFATLECELIDRSCFPTHAIARRELFDYIEGWYNPHRRHSAIHYESPMNFERHVHHQVA